MLVGEIDFDVVFFFFFSRYVPPITASSPNLPETPDEISTELRKQESLLAQIHSECNAGFVTKKREEQLWEVQRIITQLKVGEIFVSLFATFHWNLLFQRKLRTFEKKTDCAHKSLDDTVDGDISVDLNKACSDDESSIKTVTGVSTESATNTETKNTPQETPEDSALIEQKINEISESPEHAAAASVDKSVAQKVSPAVEPTAISDQVTVTDNGFMLLPENHPDYLLLIRLQLENQELMNWKGQLQARINAERAEIVRMKRLLITDDDDNGVGPLGPSSLDCTVISDNDDYERLVAQYAKENALLEQKRQLLAKEIFDESKALIQMQVELALNRYKI